MEILNHEWRWKHLYFIRTDEGIVKIRPRSDQKQILDLLYPAFFAREQKKVVILKNRQRGTSTLCSLFCEDCTAYYPGRVANTLADTQPRAASIFDNVAKFALDRIPQGLKPKADKDNVNALDFSEDIGSKFRSRISRLSKEERTKLWSSRISEGHPHRNPLIRTRTYRAEMLRFHRFAAPAQLTGAF